MRDSRRVDSDLKNPKPTTDDRGPRNVLARKTLKKSSPDHFNNNHKLVHRKGRDDTERGNPWTSNDPPHPCHYSHSSTVIGGVYPKRNDWEGRTRVSCETRSVPPLPSTRICRVSVVPFLIVTRWVPLKDLNHRRKDKITYEDLTVDQDLTDT